MSLRILISLRTPVVTAASLFFLAQGASAFPLSATADVARQGAPNVLLVAAQQDASGAPSITGWARERLSEIDATIAALEEDARKLDKDARARADTVIESVRASRDAYRAEIERSLAEGRQQTEAQLAGTRAALDKSWNEFEHNVEAYFAAVDSQVAVRQAVFKARLERQQLYWTQSIAELKTSAATVAADQRKAIDAKIATLQTKADEAKAKLAKLQQGGGAALSAFRSGLNDAGQVFDKTYDEIRAAIKNAGK